MRKLVRAAVASLVVSTVGLQADEARAQALQLNDREYFTMPGVDVLVFSNPDNLERSAGPAEPGSSRDRKNITVQLSYDGGASWPAKRVIESGYSGYSDMAALPDGSILCLFERGSIGDNHFRSAYLTLARFNLEWVGSKIR